MTHCDVHVLATAAAATMHDVTPYQRSALNAYIDDVERARPASELLIVARSNTSHISLYHGSTTARRRPRTSELVAHTQMIL